MPTWTATCRPTYLDLLLSVAEVIRRWNDSSTASVTSRLSRSCSFCWNRSNISLTSSFVCPFLTYVGTLDYTLSHCYRPQPQLTIHVLISDSCLVYWAVSVPANKSDCSQAVSGITFYSQGRRSHRIIGGHKEDWGSGRSPSRGSGLKLFCETTHKICVKIQQTTVAVTRLDILNDITSKILGRGTCPPCRIKIDAPVYSVTLCRPLVSVCLAVCYKFVS